MATKVTKFKANDKVRYSHGKGISTGTITAIEGDKAVLMTKNGKHVNRPLARLTKTA